MGAQYVSDFTMSVLKQRALVALVCAVATPPSACLQQRAAERSDFAVENKYTSPK